MNPFRQTIVLSLVLVVIMVCGVATQTTNQTIQSTNAIATNTAKATQPTTAATTNTTRQSTTTQPKITVHSGPTSTTDLTANLTYECYSNETIRLVGSDLVKSYKSLHITSDKLRSNANCTTKKESDGGFLIGGKDCFNNSLRGSLTTQHNPDIVGGKSFIEFTFECDYLPKNGTIKTVTLQVSSNIASGPTSRPAITLKPQSPNLDLQLTVTNNKNKEIGTFVDGDVEILHIKGPGAYYMYLQECIAFNGTSAGSAFSNHTLYKDFKPVDDNLIDEAKDGKQGEITINVYAFHFVGSSDVTYLCTILVCPDNTCRQNQQTNSSSRKRRAASVRSEQVETSVKVLEKYDLNGNTVSSAERTGAALFLLVVSMTLLSPLF